MKVIEKKYDENICCPFCQQIVAENEKSNELVECPHTLLITTDFGVLFGNDKLGVEMLEEENDESGWGAAVANFVDPRVVLIKTYQPAPSFSGAYYLFKRDFGSYS